jgi:hypothetical protein
MLVEFLFHSLVTLLQLNDFNANDTIACCRSHRSPSEDGAATMKFSMVVQVVEG